MHVRLRMYQVLLFKFRRHLCKGSIGYPSGQDEAILPCLGLPVISCNKNFSESHFINPLLFRQGGWILASFCFLRVYGPQLHLGPYM